MIIQVQNIKLNLELKCQKIAFDNSFSIVFNVEFTLTAMLVMTNFEMDKAVFDYSNYMNNKASIVFKGHYSQAAMPFESL